MARGATQIKKKRSEFLTLLYLHGRWENVILLHRHPAAMRDPGERHSGVSR